MPKVKGSLADVSTEYQLIEPDTYELRVDKIEVEEEKPSAEKKSGQLTYLIISKVDQPGHEHHNKPVRDYIFWYKKDGDENEYSKIQLKRYFEAILGEEEANRDDLDTDELLNGRFQAEVVIETYEDKKTKEEKQSNKLKNISALD